MYRAVLRVDRDKLGALTMPNSLHNWRSGHERLFVREGEATSLLQSRDRHSEACEADYGVQHDVSGLDQRGERVRSRAQLDTGGQQLRESSLKRAVGYRDDLRMKLLSLGGEQVDRSRCSEGTENEAVRHRSEHIESLRADRAGGTDDGYATAGIVPTRPDGRPGRRWLTGCRRHQM
jgi:hypothetical protein